LVAHEHQYQRTFQEECRPRFYLYREISGLALVLAFASSLMMSLTHYGTGTAPIIFGSGYTTLNEWWIAGAVMSVVNLTLLVVCGSIWWKFLGYF